LGHTTAELHACYACGSKLLNNMFCFMTTK